MDEKERKIISKLRKDARTSLASIAQEVQMPISTIYDKINRLHKNNIIQQYTALVDFPKLGFHHHMHLVIKVKKEQKKDLLLFLQHKSEVNSIHEINGGFDFYIETLHLSIKGYSTFIEELKECFNIKELHEYQVIGVLEKEKFL